MRCLEPKAADQRGQPHAGRGRGAESAAGEQFLGRSRPAFPSRAEAAPHLVELSLARLDRERPRPPARPYVGDRRGRRHRPGSPGLRALPQLDPALGPCAADDGLHSLTGPRDTARAIDALRRGWPVAVDQISFLAVETADPEGLAAFDAGGAPADL